MTYARKLGYYYRKSPRLEWQGFVKTLKLVKTRVSRSKHGRAARRLKRLYGEIAAMRRCEMERGA